MQTLSRHWLYDGVKYQMHIWVVHASWKGIEQTATNIFAMPSRRLPMEAWKKDGDSLISSRGSGTGPGHMQESTGWTTVPAPWQGWLVPYKGAGISRHGRKSNKKQRSAKSLPV